MLESAAAGQETIATRLAGHARRSPHATAITWRGGRLTWAELDAEATAIAAAVAAATGGRPGNVCLLLHDRAAAVQAILGVARSGCVYVPFDADDPDERLRFMFADSESVAVLAAGRSLDRARMLAPAGCAIVDLDTVARPPGPAGWGPLDRDALAHIYYTSGSTGTPKGVCQTHANQLHFADAYQRRLGIVDGDRQSLLYSVGYAAALGDIYRGIGLGATLCLYDLAAEGMAGLADWIDREGVTLLHTFPMVFREMSRRMVAGRTLAPLRVLQLDGESMFAGDFALYRAHTGSRCRLVHQLSATEIAIMAQHVLGHDSEVVEGSVIAVGPPMEGVRIEIRNGDGQVAADDVGEVFVHSRHLSPGYWRRPDLDRLAFADDPHGAGDRVYRTGDLGRLDEHGVLHFHGRAGTRTKIRGHTIDLAEIEAALAGFGDASGAAVVAEAMDAAASSSRLVAYVEPRDGAMRDPAALRRHLSQTLPPHMLPSEIRYVASLPRTSGGKLDRQRLHDAHRLPERREAIMAPRDALEAAVAHVFGEVLGIEGVGADSDFFLLGGDSLMGADLQARLASAFGVRVGDFHLDVTVAGIAARIRDARANAPG